MCRKRHSSLQRHKHIKMTGDVYTSNTYPFLQRADGMNKRDSL
jgi:hypothetical protein